MLPLSLLRAAQHHPVLIELKNGDTYNGHLESCDTWMNINLRNVILTSRDGDRFWKLPECYIRGNTIKYFRIPEDVIDMVREDDVLAAQQASKARRGGAARGGRGGRGRGGVGVGGAGRGTGAPRGRGGGSAGAGGQASGAGGGQGAHDGGARGGRGGGRGGGYRGGRGGGGGSARGGKAT